MSIDPVVGKREQGKQERKERLYEAALALFRGQGYETTTVDQISARLAWPKAPSSTTSRRKMPCCATWARARSGDWARRP